MLYIIYYVYTYFFWFNSIFTGMSLKRHEYVVDSFDSIAAQ